MTTPKESDAKLDIAPVEQPSEKIDVALLQRPAGEGLSLDELTFLARKIDDMLFEPVVIEAMSHECAAMGLASARALESVSHDLGEASRTMAAVLDDTAMERRDGMYETGGLRIWMGA